MTEPTKLQQLDTLLQEVQNANTRTSPTNCQ